MRRFVFASSCSMYGAAEGDDLLDETAPLRPLTPYAESKVGPRRRCRSSQATDSRRSSMRNATRYGASPRLRLDVVLNNLVAWAHTTGAIRLSERRDGVAATRARPRHRARDDRACSRLRRGRSRARRSTSARRIRTTGSVSSPRSCATAPRCEVEIAEGASADPRSYRVDFSKFVERSRIPFRVDCRARSRGAREAYEEVGLTFEEFQAIATRASLS